MTIRYTTPLSLTSQFFFCGLPLRLDSYRGCAFQCNFCFARYRGGNTPAAAVIPADPHTVSRRLSRAFSSSTWDESLLGQFLRRRCPVHFGGMSDPFQPAERTHGVSRCFLADLAEHHYPTVISTRSDLVAGDPYLELLQQNGNVIVQFSFVSTVTKVAARFEPRSSSPADLLRAAVRLRDAGINVTARWQPYIPGVSEKPAAFIRHVTDAGIQHVALEHLKVPFEQNHPLWSEFTCAAGSKLLGWLKDNAMNQHDGREYVLPARLKIDTVLEAREAARRFGVTFGAADNELQYLSDTACCCSGVEQFPGFSAWFKHQIGYAIRKCRRKRIVYGAIAREWLPDGSVDRWLNSHTRLGDRSGAEGSLQDHMKHRWNSVTLPFSPASFYGVVPTDEFTPSGYRVYMWDDQCLSPDREAESVESNP